MLRVHCADQDTLNPVVGQRTHFSAVHGHHHEDTGYPSARSAQRQPDRTVTTPSGLSCSVRVTSRTFNSLSAATGTDTVLVSHLDRQRPVTTSRRWTALA